MVKLRRAVGSAKNFMYIVEFVEFLPTGKIKIYTEEVNCSNTEMRRLHEETHQEVLIGHKWKICSTRFYNEFIVNHQRPILRKRKTA